MCGHTTRTLGALAGFPTVSLFFPPKPNNLYMLLLLLLPLQSVPLVPSNLSVTAGPCLRSLGELGGPGVDESQGTLTIFYYMRWSTCTSENHLGTGEWRNTPVRSLTLDWGEHYKHAFEIACSIECPALKGRRVSV